MNALHTALTELAYDLHQTGEPDKVQMAHWINRHVKAEMEKPRERRQRKVHLKGTRGKGGEFWLDAGRVRGSS